MHARRLIFLFMALLMVGCGTNSEESGSSGGGEIYDLWAYMTPHKSYEMEYDLYENGEKIDYFFETVKVLSESSVKRESGERVITLNLNNNSIKMVERGGEEIDIQRYVKVGDNDVFNAPSLDGCYVKSSLESVTLKKKEFFNLLRINCNSKEERSEFYYALDEGLVFVYKNDGRVERETVKIGERLLP